MSKYRDRKKKRFIQAGADEAKLKKIKTESGNWISASYKSGLYDKWKQRSKIDHQKVDGDDNGDDIDVEIDSLKNGRDRKIENSKKRTGKLKRAPKRELKTKEEIFKERQRLERIQTYQKKKHGERQMRQKRKGNKK